MSIIRSLHDNRRTMARVLAMIVWAAVGASTVFWGSKLVLSAAAPPALATVAASATTLRGDLTRLFGVDPPANRVEAALAVADRSRFQLIGVIASPYAHSGSQGVALIAIDGQPARAYRVGAMLDSYRVLQAVQMRGASISSRDGGASILLELPALPSAATGSPPATASDNRQAGMQTQPLNQIPRVHPPTPNNGRLQGYAPNTQLNNPADMAQPETGSSEERATR